MHQHSSADLNRLDIRDVHANGLEQVPEQPDDVISLPDPRPMAGGYHGGDGGNYVGDIGADLFEDVFGPSDDAEATMTASTTAASTARGGSQPGADEGGGPAWASAASATLHPSDMPRLRQEHTTAGYRDGLVAAKAASVQAGFDEGYALGAALGLVVGALLGVLEGLVEGSNDGDVRSALAQARQDLDVRALYAPLYFAPDGTWKYAVLEADASEPANHGGGSGDGDGNAGQDSIDSINSSEPTIFDVALAHPLVHRWRQTADVLTRRWGVQWGGLAVLGQTSGQPGGDNCSGAGEAFVQAALGMADEEDEEEGGASAAATAVMTATAAATRRSAAAATTTASATTTARPPPSSSNAQLDW